MFDENNHSNSRNTNGGPRTPQGKAISSQNARTHGLCSEKLILATENIEDYQALEAIWFNSYNPKDDAEVLLVKRLVDSEWLLDRATRTLAEVEAAIYECGYLPINWSDDNHLKLTRITRYHTSRVNASAKARKAIEDYRKNRTNEIVKAEKHEVYKDKAKPEPSLRDLLAQKKQNHQTAKDVENREAEREPNLK